MIIVENEKYHKNISNWTKFFPDQKYLVDQRFSYGQNCSPQKLRSSFLSLKQKKECKTKNEDDQKKLKQKQTRESSMIFVENEL